MTERTGRRVMRYWKRLEPQDAVTKSCHLFMGLALPKACVSWVRAFFGRNATMPNFSHKNTHSCIKSGVSSVGTRRDVECLTSELAMPTVRS